MTEIKTSVTKDLVGQGYQTIAFRVEVPDHLSQSALNQMKVFARAMSVYAERNELYRDNWIRTGFRGALIRLRERTERLWDTLWDGEPTPEKMDDAIDLINFAGFLIRGAEGEATRGGDWWPQ